MPRPSDPVRAGLSARSSSVLAVVVTYNPGVDLPRNLAALREQVETIVVVDNGSTDVERVKIATRGVGGRIVANGSNLGVATAFNQAARMARDEGFGWLAIFDQDSLVRPAAIEGLLALEEVHPQRSRIAILAMSHADRAMARDYHRDFDVLDEGADWRSVRSTISSGSMVRVCVFDKVGLFEDRLFIDAVDHEFCLRCRAMNLLVIEGKKEMLEHSMGDATAHKLLWKSVICTNHSATRRYYITRNVPSVCIRYASMDFTWALHGLIDLVVGSLFVLLFERDRPAKVLAMLSGGCDALIGRFGKRP